VYYLYKNITYNKASKKISVFLCRYVEQREVVKKMKKYISLARRIQEHWKKRLMTDKAHKALLVENWENIREKLISKYQKMGKKHKILVDKLAMLDKRQRDKIIEDHYRISRLRFIISFKKWLKSSRLYANYQYQNQHTKYMDMTPRENLFPSKRTIEFSGNIYSSLTRKGKPIARALNEGNKDMLLFSRTLNLNAKPQSVLIEKPVFSFIPEENELINMLIKAAEGKYH